MKRKKTMATFLAMLLGISWTPIYAQGEDPVRLPPPQTQGGKPLMQVLSERKSTREFSSKQLPEQVLSDLLWAAAGINRPATGHRTSPSAENQQEIDIYVAMADGVFLYDAKENALIPYLNQDVRALTGMQPFVKVAPVNLIYVADHGKMKNMTAEEKEFYAATDTGFISENVYLYCASEGLVTVVRNWMNKLTLKKALGLRDSQTIILTQTVGYPA